MSAIGATVPSSNQSAVAELSQQFNRNTTAPAPVSLNANDAPAVKKAGTDIGSPERDFVRVSSSIGRAASTGQLSRQEALDIYRQVASLL